MLSVYKDNNCLDTIKVYDNKKDVVVTMKEEKKTLKYQEK